MKIQGKKYYEVRPGFDSVRFVLTYALLTLLARQAQNRPFKLFTELTGNIDRHILSEGLFERGVIDLLSDVIRSVGHRKLMIDIGANIGNHTVAWASLFDKVEAVEPHPVLFRVLTANVLRNQLSHVTCHNFGLAGEDAHGTLAESPGNHAISRVKERSRLSPEIFGLSNDEFANEYSIELRSTAEFLSAYGESLDECFIKIDVEGMEQEILTAMRPLLARYKPLIGFEWFTKQQPELTEMVSNLEGYRLMGIRQHDVGKNRLWRSVKLVFTGRSYQLEPLTADNLDDFYPLAVLVPSSRALD